MRLDVALVEQGLSRSRTRSAGLIADNKVTVNGKVVSKASFKVEPNDSIAILGQSDQEFASRASYKLLRTIEALDGEIALDGRLALDVGASTGGFTDVLLRANIGHVIALDVGHDQLVPEIRNDPRVTVLERYNARELRSGDLAYAPNLVVCDVSFISITLLLPAIAKVVTPDCDLLLMVKPQFEVGKNSVGAQGVVRDPQLHAQAILAVARSAAEHRLTAKAIIPSALPGPHGNREFFIWLKPHNDHHGQLSEKLVEVVQRAVEHGTQLSDAGVMIEDEALMPVLKGMPDQQVVPSTSVYWV